MEETIGLRTTFEKKRCVFAYGMNFYKLFWVYLISSFLGVILETLWCLIIQHKLEFRWGVIYGPFNAVYGFGAVIMTLCLNKISFLRDLWIFIICMFIGGAFEYICSVFQETVLNTVSWDYSGEIGSFGGRTSLLFAFFWGLLGLLWVKDIYPRLSQLIEKIPMKTGKILTWILFIYMIFNLLISEAALIRQRQRNQGITASNSIERFLDENYSDEFLMIMYPNAMNVENK